MHPTGSTNWSRSSTGESRRKTEALIETVDNEIDALVYEPYGLSEDEVAIVEGG